MSCSSLPNKLLLCSAARGGDLPPSAPAAEYSCYHRVRLSSYGAPMVMIIKVLLLLLYKLASYWFLGVLKTYLQRHRCWLQ